MPYANRTFRSMRMAGDGEYVDVVTNDGGNLRTIALDSGLTFQIDIGLSIQTPVAGQLCLFGLEGYTRDIHVNIERFNAGNDLALRFIDPTDAVDFFVPDVI